MTAKIWTASSVTIGILGTVIGLALAETGTAQKPAADDKNWQAVAPGLVEPRSGEIKVTAPVIGLISEVMVQSGEKVIADEPLIRLDDEGARARVATSQAQVEMRKRARNDQGAGKAADRRKAEDGVAEAEAAVVQTRDSFDAAVKAKHGGSGSDADLTAARTAWSGAQERLVQKRAQLHKLDDDPDTPLPTANEGQLNVARGELRTAVAELESSRSAPRSRALSCKSMPRSANWRRPMRRRRWRSLATSPACACARRSTNAMSARSSSAARPWSAPMHSAAANFPARSSRSRHWFSRRGSIRRARAISATSASPTC